MIRLVDHLRGQGMSNREARGALQSGKVYLGDAPTADPTRLVDPAAVSVRPNAPRVRVGVDPVMVHRDAHLAVVFKPSGMLSVPAPGRRAERTLIGEVSRALRGAFVVHRIDEETSGLMMVARTESCQKLLKDLLLVHEVERVYLAMVRGRLDPARQTVDTALVRDRGDGLRGSGDPRDPDARRAVTHLERIETLGRGASLVRARLETGRTHQVRIHLAELGHPVLGDRLYGRGAGPAAPRLALHAHRLALRHPVTGEPLRFEAPLADDLERLRRKLAG